MDANAVAQGVVHSHGYTAPESCAPHWSRQSWLLRPARARPLLFIVVLGLSLRLVAALVGHGWFAADDYLYAIDPAWRWLTQPDYVFSSAYRSELLPRVLSWFFSLARAAGAGEPTSALHVAYAGLGLWSVLAIPGTYCLARRLGERAALAAAALVAAEAIFPQISTRALITVVAIPPLVWGLVAVDRARDRARRALAGPHRDCPDPKGLVASEQERTRVAIQCAALSCLGALGVGLASLLRFQVGVVYLAVFGLLVTDALVLLGARARGAATAAWAGIGGFLAGGVLATLAQGALDRAAGRELLGTVFNYVSFNAQHSQSFGTSPWYNYLLQLLAYSVPPATVLLLRPAARAFRAHGVVAVAFSAFVISHSLVGHKEDRFLFTILPLFFVLLGAGLAEAWKGGRLARATCWFFWSANAAGLVVSLSSDAFLNLTRPIAEVARTSPDATLATVGLKLVPRYYWGRSSGLLAAGDLDELAQALEQGAPRPQFVLFGAEPNADALARLSTLGLSCGTPRLYPGDLVDQALVFLNPRHNRRRAATALLDCRTSPPAVTTR